MIKSEVLPKQNSNLADGMNSRVQEDVEFLVTKRWTSRTYVNRYFQCIETPVVVKRWKKAYHNIYLRI